MIISMTGYGQAQACEKGIVINTECQSVNNRYLDITLRLPDVIQEKEFELKELIQTRINRGSLNVQISIDEKATGQPDYVVNEKLVRGYKKLLDELSEAAGLKEPATIRDLMEFDSIFTARPQDAQTTALIWNLAKQTVNDALKQLTRMRRQEGGQLQNDLHERIETIRTLIEDINAFTENRAKELHQLLLKRIQNLIDDENLDEGRLEMEVALLVDKMDITEEIVRLKSHIKFFKETLQMEQPVGRRLKFLCQEMNREVNTIGSKSNHSQISQLVVQSKECLEQIREQVLNVE